MKRGKEPGRQVPVRIVPVMDARARQRPAGGGSLFLQHVAPLTGNLPATPPTLHTARWQHRHLCDANLPSVLGNALGVARGKYIVGLVGAGVGAPGARWEWNGGLPAVRCHCSALGPQEEGKRTHSTAGF